MSDRPITISMRSYGHTDEFKNGNVKVPGVEFEFVDVKPQVAAFRRMIRDQEFDICELAPTTYMIAKSFDIAPYKAIPVFFERRFHHGGFVVREDAGIDGPRDLEGKKAGVRSYTGTTGVWTRGILMNEYDLDNDKVTWVVDDEEHVTQLKLPPNVEQVPPKSLPKMMAAGEIHAGFLTRADKEDGQGHSGLGRAGDAAETAKYRELFENPFELGAEWYGRTGIYPMHSLIVIRDDVVAANPDLPKALYDALSESKAYHIDRLNSGAADKLIDDRYRRQRDVVGGDPLPYGLEANRKTLDALKLYATQQHLLARDVAIDDLFFDLN